MKARYTQISGRDKEVFNRKIIEMQTKYAILWEKLFIYTMYTQFGIGELRLKRWINAMCDGVDEMHSDPAFWDKVDKTVIEKLGFDYPECDHEFMEKTFYQPPKVTAEEKRNAVADMRKMREFLENNKVGFAENS